MRWLCPSLEFQRYFFKGNESELLQCSLLARFGNDQGNATLAPWPYHYKNRENGERFFSLLLSLQQLNLSVSLRCALQQLQQLFSNLQITSIKSKYYVLKIINHSSAA